MRLTNAQCEQYHDQGYLFVPALFDDAEIARLRAEVPRIFAQRRPEVWREKHSDEVRVAFAVHLYNDLYGQLARHPRLVEPAMQLVGEPTYIHQFKVNPKAAFHGEVWQWHQDFGTWHVADGMPEPRAMNLALFLDPVNEFNGPLTVIPGSHKQGKLEASHDTETTSYPLWTISEAEVRALVEAGGLAAPKGPAGSALFFHCNLVHASAGNLSPFDRNVVYLTANAVSNHIQAPTRPEFIASRDFTPNTPLADDCLLDRAHSEALSG